MTLLQSRERTRLQVETMPPAERPAEFAILGLLATEESGSHGYDLARAFTAGEPLGAILRLEAGMLYHHLKRLERAGSVTQSIAKAGSRPPRQIYRLTEAGRERLFTWLQSPVEHTREIRLDFLVKLYFAGRLEPELATRLIDTQLRTLIELRESLAREDATDAFLRSVTELRTAQTEAAIRWLESLNRAGKPAQTRRTGV